MSSPYWRLSVSPSLPTEFGYSRDVKIPLRSHAPTASPAQALQEFLSFRLDKSLKKRHRVLWLSRMVYARDNYSATCNWP